MTSLSPGDNVGRGKLVNDVKPALVPQLVKPAGHDFLVRF